MKKRQRARALGQAVPAQKCKFVTAKAKQAALTEFLRTHAADLPPETIRSATTVDKLQTWVTLCDERGIAAAMRYEHNDWYLCTVKNAAVRPDLRGRGLGRELYQRTAEKAVNNPMCKVLAADVDYDNLASIRALERAGFRSVNEFCWERGQKPAKILHYVRTPPKGTTCP